MKEKDELLQNKDAEIADLEAQLQMERLRNAQILPDENYHLQQTQQQTKQQTQQQTKQ